MNLSLRYKKSLSAISLVALPLLGAFALLSQVVVAQGASANVSHVAQAGQDRKAEADKLVELGKQQNGNSQYQDALKSYQSALNFYRLIKDLKGEVTSLIGLGYAYGNQGKYQKGLEFFQQALAISKQTGDRISEVESLMGIGFAYGNLGDFQKRLDYDQQAVNLAKLIGDRQNEAEGLYRLGLTSELNVRDYEKAIDYYQKSLVINQQINNRKGAINSLLALGSAYYVLGKYQKTIDYYQQSLPISKQLGNSSVEANSLGSIAYIYAALGMYQKAIAYNQQSLALSKKIGNPYGEGVSLVNLGEIYNLLGQYQKAIDYFSQSILIAKKLNHLYMESAILTNFGNSYKYLENYQKAVDYYQQALTIFTQNKNFGDYDKGNLFNELGNVYSLLGENQTAIDYYQQSLEVFKKFGSRGGEAETLKSFGKLFAKLQQPEFAILFYKQSINITELIRKDIRGLSKEEQKFYLSTVETTYRNLADLLLKQDRILEAQQVLDLLKVQELSDYLKTIRGNSQTAQGVDLQRPEQNIIASISELNTLQQKDRDNKLSETEQQRLAQLVQTERDHNKQFNAFLNSPEIQKLIDQLRRAEQQQNINLTSYRKLQKDVLSQLPKAVLIYPLILDDRLELILINAKTPPLRRTIKIKRQELNEAISQFLGDLRDVGSEDVKQPAQKLYNLLIKPFESELNQLKIDTIIYAPDGQLRYIPLAGLYDGKQWLVEKYRVNNITAESLTTFNSKPISNPHILAGAFGGKGNEKRSGFNGLPASIIEVQKIASQFPNTTKLIENEFTKSVTETRANSHTILHLATHGELSVGTPEDSFILFGNGEKATIRDIQDWKLSNIDLVVLSACQSGLGSKLGTGVEILGLGYQMQAAGARVAIASLWKVDDAGTQALMDAFYNELKKGDVSIAEVLRRAQVSLIKSPKLDHPFYWSAFFAIGNGL